LANQTTDLVLDYLRRQREQPDPELFKEMNWTERDMREFLQRYEAAKDLSARAQPIERQPDELNKLNLQSSSGVVGPTAANDNYRNQTDAARIRPPDSLRKRVEAFQEALRKGQ
jgi:hypothetical protein